LTENLPILTGKTLSLIDLFGLYMRLLDSISILNSRQGIRPFKLEHTKLLDRDGIEPIVGVFYHLRLKRLVNQNTFRNQ